ncbi:MAG: diphthamide biosynthesis enzyme Dph2 [Methanothermobacter sp.]|nr:diphthamide biosynthesis enzyme Dph2 [Methanothermobacter sp.]
MSLYRLETERVIGEIRKRNAGVVGLQFPEGLKMRAVELAEQIESETGATAVISADPCFGACDVSDRKMRDMVDLIVHYGHTPLPLDYEVPVIFIEAASSVEVGEVIREAADRLSGHRRIGIATTAQHLHLLDQARSLLEERGFEVVTGEGVNTARGQVLGCNFSAIRGTDADAYLFLGSGNFHPLGIKLFTGREVVVADPYHGEVRDIEEFADRVLRVRFARISRAADASKWGVVVSSKAGQMRFELALMVKKKLEEAGREALILLAENISPAALLPFRELEAFVVTACPRIAIDDSQLYDRPLLNPSELEIVLGERSWDDYTLDEIIHG